MEKITVFSAVRRAETLAEAGREIVVEVGYEGLQIRTGFEHCCMVTGRPEKVLIVEHGFFNDNGELDNGFQFAIPASLELFFDGTTAFGVVCGMLFTIYAK